VRMRRALDELTTDDPSLVVVTDADTGRTLLAGMGELHLELAIERLTREHGLSVRSGQLAPRQRAILASDAAGRGSYVAPTIPRAEVEVGVELRRAATIDESVTYEAEAPPRADWRLALEAGVARAVYHDAQIIGVSAVLVDLVYRGAGLTPRAFWEAGRRAGETAIARAGAQRAEPWMSLAIVVPGEHVGRVTADLARRRGRISGSQSRGVLQVLAAEAPLAELIRYATELRSLTAGRGTFTMEPLGYRAL
jgi:elongation factor G